MAEQMLSADKPVYPWPRFWTEGGAGESEQVDGFLPDPTKPPSWLEPPVTAYRLAELLDEPCLILLAPPGFGKTFAVRQAVDSLSGEEAGPIVRRIDLAAYDEPGLLRTKLVDSTWKTWLEGDRTLFLFLDSLDEALLHHHSIHKLLLEELDAVDQALPRLRLRIACRSAEWLPELGQGLNSLWRSASSDGDSVLKYYVLARLRAVDASEAARVEGLDGEEFLRTIRERNLEHLAAVPLTLSMLLEAAKEEEGLPSTRSELFLRAAIRLAAEHDTARSRAVGISGLSPGERVAIAERVAASSLLSGRTQIGIDPGLAAVRAVDPAEITGFSEEDVSAAGGAAFEVGSDEIVETLRTALFTRTGSSGVGFWHRQLGEYLAARYIARHQLDADQLSAVLVDPDDDEGRIIPQLREIAAWTIAVYPDAVSEILQREPDVFLRVDELEVEAEVAAQVIAALLEEDVADRIPRWDDRIWRGLRRLDHPSIGEQLSGPIRDAAAPLSVRKLAITIAKACETTSSEGDLLALALDSNEPAFLRDDATWALKEYASVETRRELVPLVMEPIDDDSDDEVKGQALSATVPEILSVSEVLPVITRPRNESLLGSYATFLRRQLPEALDLAQLPAALEWAAGVEPDHHATDDLNLLVDAIIEKAWTHLDDSAIASGVAAVVRTRLRAHVDLLTALASDIDKRVFQEVKGRRVLVALLIDEIDDDPKKRDKIHPRRIPGSKPSLLQSGDASWLLEEFQAALGSEDEEAWAGLIAAVLWAGDPEMEQVYELMGQSEALEARFGHWFRPIDLDSDLAMQLRENDRYNREVDEVADDAPDMDQEIRRALDEFEAGELKAWSRVNYALGFGPRGQGSSHSVLEADLTKLPGWERARVEDRDRMVDAAVKFLESSGAEPASWFATNRLVAGPAAGYRALYLLARERPQVFRDLADEIWERWASIIVDYPRGNADEEALDSEIVRQAVIKAPGTIADWVARKIDHERVVNDGALFVLYRLDEIDEPVISGVLVEKLSEPEMQAKSLADLLRWASAREPARCLELAAPYLQIEAGSTDPEARDRCRSVGSVLLAGAPSQAWALVQPVVTADLDLGREIFEEVASRERADLATDLTGNQLDEVVTWMFEAFPPAEDPGLEAGGSWVSPLESATGLRDRLASVLAERGTDESIETISALEGAHSTPALKSLLRTAKEARRSRWRAPEPGDVVRLAKLNDARIVLSAQHLHLAVLAALRRITKAVRTGQPPAAAELWGGDLSRPKDEEPLSDWLANRLRYELTTGGKVVNREVLVAPSASGKGRGQSTDIEVTTPVGRFVAEAESAKIIIEVKGCWNPSLTTEMKDQLVERYLATSGTDNGIYLVFWFDDCGRDRCKAPSCDELLGTLAQQAVELSEGSVHVEAFVIDGSLPTSD